MSNRPAAAHTLVARFPGVCAVSGQRFAAGASIVRCPGGYALAGVELPARAPVAEALEVVRAKSARWASTFDPADETVLCRRREYARRADGTIVGLSLGRAVARMVEVRRPVVEVAAELQAQAAAAARRVADLAVARAEQAARWRAQAASLRLQADAAEADLPGLEHLPGAVRDAAASQVALLRAEAAELERLAGS